MMLALPVKGINRSTNVHNSDINIFCDWIESSAVFTVDRISKSDIVDILKENEIYDDSDFALEFVDRAWIILKERFEYLLSPYGLTANINHIERIGEWTDFPSYAFCLAITSAAHYNNNIVYSKHGSYTTQGELFEEISVVSFTNALKGWNVRRIGWGAGNPLPLRSVLDSIIKDLSESNGAEVDVHIDENTKELGLDLLAYYTFGDSQASIPVLLVQCATGKNWKSKKHTPDIEVWKKIVSFNSNPVKAFAMPYAFADKIEYRKETTSVKGVFLDRYRLLGALRRNNVDVSTDLNTRILNWLNPIIVDLPRLDV